MVLSIYGCLAPFRFAAINIHMATHYGKSNLVAACVTIEKGNTTVLCSNVSV